MTTRRDLLLGATCVAGSVAAFALEPRRYRSLMPPRGSLDQMSPVTFGDWTGRDVTDLVAPKTEGSLLSRLYDQTIERIYANAATGAEVMMLLAHGDTQSNELQLHRPEVCYPAFGFDISASSKVDLPLKSAAALPARALVASAPGRRENIIYWTRLGEFLPTTELEQRVDRAKTALHGDIADGMLARFSLVSEDTDAALSTLKAFIELFMQNVAAVNRATFVGSAIAAAMAGGAA